MSLPPRSKFALVHPPPEEEGDVKAIPAKNTYVKFYI
jgi:hypothetical protein